MHDAAATSTFRKVATPKQSQPYDCVGLGHGMQIGCGGNLKQKDEKNLIFINQNAVLVHSG